MGLLDDAKEKNKDAANHVDNKIQEEKGRMEERHEQEQERQREEDLDEDADEYEPEEKDV